MKTIFVTLSAASDYTRINAIKQEMGGHFNNVNLVVCENDCYCRFSFSFREKSIGAELKALTTLQSLKVDGCEFDCIDEHGRACWKC